MNPNPVAIAGEYALSWRPARPDDETFLYDLFRGARAELFAPLGWDEGRMDQLLRGQYEAQRRDYTSNYPDSIRRVILLKNEPVAMAWVHARPSELRLLDIIVAGPRRCAGIGTQILNGLQREASAAGVPLRHMVALDNPRAKLLYDRTGFTVVSEIAAHLLMEWVPSPPASSPPG